MAGEKGKKSKAVKANKKTKIPPTARAGLPGEWAGATIPSLGFVKLYEPSGHFHPISTPGQEKPKKKAKNPPAPAQP